MKYPISLSALISVLLLGCQSPEAPSETFREDTNPAAAGFRYEDSDPKAIALADSVMEAMGGRKAWDAARYLGWNFFGRRYLVWDKEDKRVRIEIPAENAIYLLDLDAQSGRVFLNGEEINEPALKDSLVKRGIGIWINDSYWLVMPYKLKDSGVALRYDGKGLTTDGKEAEMLTLTFKEVGNTPDNKYQVYIDPESFLVSQWDYFQDRQDSLPRLSSPWKDYREMGGILLSGDRGMNQLSDIRIWAELPDEIFTSPKRSGDLLPVK